MTPLLVGLVVLALAVMLARSGLHRITVFEYERGLLYVRGHFRGLLEPGQYWIWTPSRAVTKVDIRLRIAAVPGQEVLTADGIAVKVSLVAQYRVLDPAVAINGQASYEVALYTELQLAVRRLISAEPIEALLEKRSQFASQLTESVREAVARLGVELVESDVKDLTLPGDLKKLFTQVTKARQEGLAALERARGETASLRSLANAARLVQDNPTLMQLRLLQVLGEQAGNTVVLGMANGSPVIPVPQRGERLDKPHSAAPEA